MYIYKSYKCEFVDHTTNLMFLCTAVCYVYNCDMYKTHSLQLLAVRSNVNVTITKELSTYYADKEHHDQVGSSLPNKVWQFIPSTFRGGLIIIYPRKFAIAVLYMAMRMRGAGARTHVALYLGLGFCNAKLFHLQITFVHR